MAIVRASAVCLAVLTGLLTFTNLLIAVIALIVAFPLLSVAAANAYFALAMETLRAFGIASTPVEAAFFVTKVGRTDFDHACQLAGAATITLAR